MKTLEKFKNSGRININSTDRKNINLLLNKFTILRREKALKINPPIELEFSREKTLVTWNEQGLIKMELHPDEFLTVIGETIAHLAGQLHKTKKHSAKRGV